MENTEAEIKALKDRLKTLEKKPVPQASKGGANLKGLAILAVILFAAGGIFAALWNSGKQQAMQDEAFGFPCELASETPDEASACVSSMKASYAGPMNDPDRVANAAAQYVADYRASK
jgi:hypothetical protein